ncbi:O-antigen ligase family protein [Neisseriaceae bacterium JH1-16]|nr:O-antigen ligase family protein [Neisseriaceae bacterium JH1-16]
MGRKENPSTQLRRLSEIAMTSACRRLFAREEHLTPQDRSTLLFRALWLFCLTLPVAQGPKNIAAFLVLVAFLFNLETFRRRLHGPAFWAGLTFFTAGVVSIAINAPASNLLAGFKDSLMIPLLFWIGCFGSLTEQQKRRLFFALVASSTIALLLGYVDICQGKKKLLELHGAGVVTQSSVYLGMIAAAYFGYIATQWHGLTRRTRVGHLGLLGFQLLSLLLMASRSGLLGTGVCMLLLAAVYFGRKKAVVGLLAAAVLGSGGLYALPNDFNQQRLLVKEQQQFTTGKLAPVDAYRFYHWQVAINFFRDTDHKLFGIGPRQFDTIKGTEYAAPPASAIQGKREVERLSSAHNLFLTKLVEEGLLGLGAMLWLFGLVGKTLLQVQDKRHWLWGVGLAGLVVPCLGSFFNAPFFQEYAWLAGLMLGLFCATTPLAARQPVREGLRPRYRSPIGTAHPQHGTSHLRTHGHGHE